MPSPGDIIFYKDFEFENRTKGDKFFVVLNSVDIETKCLVLKTTSDPQKKYLGVKEGCNPERKLFFIPTNWKEYNRKLEYKIYT